MNEIKYFSMFTGVGGFELGFEEASNLFKEKEEQIREKDEKEIREQASENKIERYAGLGTSSTKSVQYNNRGSNRQFGCIGKRSTNDNEKIWRSGETENLSKQGSGSIMCEPIIGSNSFSCVGFSEFDKYSNQLLAQKFPTIKNWGDCTKINPNELPDFDMLCGGTPCQDFSIAGKRKGLHKEDGTLTRSGLFYHFLRVAETGKPKYILMENVKGMLSSKNPQGEYNFDNMMEAMCELGYAIDFTILNSKFFGVPQNRERVFILAVRLDCIDKAKVI